MKPLFRWTIGPTLPQGREILAESIKTTTRCLGVDRFDWLICYNGLNIEDVRFIHEAIGNLPIQLYAQNWAMCPIPDNCQTPRRKDGSFEFNGNRCGGTMWKVCPARMRMESHEIVMDNDVVMRTPFPQIEEFLSSTDKALILEEPIRFYGRYDHLFPEGPEGPFLNSGFMGFPPGFDFAARINEKWIEQGSHINLSQADEQGLLMYALSSIPSVRVNKEQMVEFLGRDYNKTLSGDELAIHFTQANRMPNHRGWIRYTKMKSDGSFQ